MKKVNSIGKKLMSVGLSASLLMGSVGVNSCFAGGTITTVEQKATEQKKSNEFKIEATVKEVDSNKKISEEKKKPGFKENMKKAWAICKWLVASGVLMYFGIKNCEDIIMFCKEFCNFFVNNKDLFAEIASGGWTVLKGAGAAIKGTSSVVMKAIKFIAEHPEASKNVMAAVGTYSVGKGLYDKAKKLFSRNKSGAKKENTYNITAKVSVK